MPAPHSPAPALVPPSEMLSPPRFAGYGLELSHRCSSRTLTGAGAGQGSGCSLPKASRRARQSASWGSGQRREGAVTRSLVGSIWAVPDSVTQQDGPHASAIHAGHLPRSAVQLPCSQRKEELVPRHRPSHSLFGVPLFIHLWVPAS